MLLHLSVCDRATRSQIPASHFRFDTASKSSALTRNFQINYLWVFFIKYIPQNYLIWFWYFRFHRYTHTDTHTQTECVLCCSRGFGHSVDHVKRTLITHNVHEKSKINRLRSLARSLSLCPTICLSFFD